MYTLGRSILMTPTMLLLLAHRIRKICQSLRAFEPRILNNPGIGITGEIGRPLYESRPLMGARGDGVAANGR